MTSLHVVSSNPHYHCRTVNPCDLCRDQIAAEREARDRHPAGTDLPTSLEFEQGWDENGTYVTVNVDDHGTTLELDETMLRELLAAATADPPLCRRDGCPYWAVKGNPEGLCAGHLDRLDTVPMNGWRS